MCTVPRFLLFSYWLCSFWFLVVIEAPGQCMLWFAYMHHARGALCLGFALVHWTAVWVKRCCQVLTSLLHAISVIWPLVFQACCQFLFCCVRGLVFGPQVIIFFPSCLNHFSFVGVFIPPLRTLSLLAASFDFVNRWFFLNKSKTKDKRVAVHLTFISGLLVCGVFTHLLFECFTPAVILQTWQESSMWKP